MARTPYGSVVRDKPSGSFDFAPKIVAEDEFHWRSAQDDTGVGWLDWYGNPGWHWGL